MIETTDDALEYMGVQTQKAIDATEHEVRGALLVLALAARRDFEHPQAEYIVFEDSDQGPWLTVVDVLDEGGEVIDGSDDWYEGDTDASAHLYDHMKHVWEPFMPVINDSRTSPRWRLDIGHVLDAIKIEVTA